MKFNKKNEDVHTSKTKQIRIQKFLDEINSTIPKEIDWKKGARDYCKLLNRVEGEGSERYHLIKPFVGGPDFEPFFTDSYNFLNMMKKLNLKPHSRILDVACGPGWVSHFLAKLGHSVVGIDISEKFINLARYRISNDPLPPFIGKPFDVTFEVCDIEETAYDKEDYFDVAFLESALHHFYDPVSALNNVSHSLKKDGLLAIIEGAAPDNSSQPNKKNNAIMQQYHTLERPYSHDQMKELLQLTGFWYSEFYFSFNGYFIQSQESVNQIKNALINGKRGNICIASKSQDAIKRISPHHQSTLQVQDNIEFNDGFFQEEINDKGSAFHWSGPQSCLKLYNISSVDLRISSCFPQFQNKNQNIYLSLNEQHSLSRVLSRDNDSVIITLTDLTETSDIIFSSDSVFSPRWYGSEDNRMLSFTVEIISFQKK